MLSVTQNRHLEIKVAKQELWFEKLYKQTLKLNLTNNMYQTLFKMAAWAVNE